MESPDASTLAETVLTRFVASVEHATQPFLLGLSGLPGSGAPALAAALVDAAGKRGWAAVAVSLEDASLTHDERRELAARVHPLLADRGVPGTHDLALLTSTIDALNKAAPERPVSVPRFDAGSDERYATGMWPEVPYPPKLVVVEGWCVGVDAQDAAALVAPVNALERNDDADGTCRRWVNEKLRDYLPLWRRLDALVLLASDSWEAVVHSQGNATGTGADGTSRALQHYERLGRHAIASLPGKADLILTPGGADYSSAA